MRQEEQLDLFESNEKDQNYIFSDAFISKLYSMDWRVRNKFFVDQFPNLRLEEVSELSQRLGIIRIGKSDFENPPEWENLDTKPPYVEGYKLEDYLNLIPDFKDPYPCYVIEHDGILVVRDDLIPGNLGSKARYAEALMQRVEEKYLFYAMVNSGQAMKVLASTAKRYGKVVVGIAPLRKEPTIGHIEAMHHGAIMLYYQTGGMAGARKRCRAFIHDQLEGKGLYIPAGVKHPYITAGFASCVSKIYNQYKPDAIFCATSTATMAHGIMVGTPSSCEVHAVQVAGNSSLRKWPGRAVCYEHDQPFTEKVRPQHTPPFNSISTYDAKAWQYAVWYKKEHPEKKVMFWNVAGETSLDDVKKVTW